MNGPDRPGPDAAYALETPEDNIGFYRRWATSYESDMAAERGYVFPERLAALYAERAETRLPVLDVGSGTGLVGRALRAFGVVDVDGVDISPEMLAVADERGGYRRLAVADVTKPLAIEDGAYGGVISAGAFTLGHLGPEPFDELARVAAPDALLALGVKEEHWRAAGFAAKVEAMREAGVLRDVETPLLRYYRDDVTHEHRDDRMVVLLARRGG